MSLKFNERPATDRLRPVQTRLPNTKTCQRIAKDQRPWSSPVFCGFPNWEDQTRPENTNWMRYCQNIHLRVSQPFLIHPFWMFLGLFCLESHMGKGMCRYRYRQDLAGYLYYSLISIHIICAFLRISLNSRDFHNDQEMPTESRLKIT